MAISPFLCVLSAAAFLFLCTHRRAGAPRRNHRPPRKPAPLPWTVSRRRGSWSAPAGSNDALAMLRPLARGRRVDADVLFQIGMAAIGASQKRGVSEDARDALLDEAIAAFHTMLVGRPGLIRVRLELARAFFLKAEDKLARSPFRAGPRRQAAGGGGAQRQPFPQPHAGAQALEPAPRRQRSRPTAISPPGRTSRRSCSTPLSDGFRSPSARPTSPNPASASRSGPPANTSTRWRSAGGCARALTSRAASTARTSSTG